MDFMKRLYDLREDADLTQRELANKLNLKPSAISKYEKGVSNPSIPMLMKISEVFNVSVDYLLGLSSVKNPYSPETFTPKEAEIVFKYRKLTKENRIRIDERLSAMIDGQRRG